ncbi:hypothetical protein U1Q18_028442 [Sarracenia purpurea var. burkii]
MTADDLELSFSDPGHVKPVTNSLSSSSISPSVGTPRRSSGLMGRFSQLLSLDTEEPRSQPTEQLLAAHQCTLQTIQKCHIDCIFTESRPHNGNNSSSPEDEDTAVFCIIVQSTVMPCALFEKAVFGLLWICHRLLAYKENLADELLGTDVGTDVVTR